MVKIRTDQFPVATAVVATDVALGIVDGDDVRIPLSLILGLVDVSAGAITVSNDGHVYMTAVDLQGQLDQADARLVSYLTALSNHVIAEGAHQASVIQTPALSIITGEYVSEQLESVDGLIDGLQVAVDALDTAVDLNTTAIVTLESVVAGLQLPTVFSMALEQATPVAGFKYLWIATANFAVSKVHARRTGGTGLVLNVRVNGADYVLNSDLSLTTTSFTSADANGTFVSENQIVEVEVISQSGSPTLLEVQVDFENVPLP